MTILIYIILILAFFYANYYRGHRTLHMLQQIFIMKIIDT